MNDPLLPHEILDEEPEPESAPFATRLPAAVSDGVLCSEQCPFLRRTFDGDPMCGVFGDEPLHPSFEAETLDSDRPRAERCDHCLVAQDIWEPR